VYPMDALLQLRPLDPMAVAAPAGLNIPAMGEGGRPELLRSELSEPREGNGRGRNRPFNNNNNNNRKGNRRGRDNDTAPALEDCEPLAIDESTRWKSRAMGNKDEVDRDEALERRVRSLLNKLTLELFGKISRQLIGLAQAEINTPARLRDFANAVVIKAQNEHHFCAMYAELCRSLALEPVLDDALEKPKHFRSALLTRCQEEFNEDLATRMERAEREATEEELDEEDKALLLIRTKRAYLGHMKFLGELFLKDLLKEKIVHEVIDILFSDGGEKDEERLECLCKLLSTVGHKLEFGTAKAKYRDLIGKYFEELVKLGEDPELPSRTRFMCKDVVELRKNDYASRRQEEVAKTISEVRAEAEAELERQEAAKRRNGKGKDRRGGKGMSKPRLSRSSSTSSPKNTADPDGWNTAGSAKMMKAPKLQRAPSAPSSHSNSTSMSMFSMLDGEDRKEKKKKKKDKKEKEEKKKKKKKDRSEDASLSPTAAASPAAAGMSEDAAKRGCWEAIEEFQLGNDEAELLNCLGECARALEAYGGAHAAPSAIMLKSFEAKADVRGLAVTCVAKAAKQAVAGFGAAALTRAVHEQLELMWDFKIDIPRIDDYIAAFVGPLLAQGSLGLKFLESAPEAFRRPDAEFNPGAEPAAFVVKCVCSAKASGLDDVNTLVAADGGFDFSTVFPEGTEAPDVAGAEMLTAALA